MKANHLIALAALLLAGQAHGAILDVFGSKAFENEPFILFSLHRDGDSLVQSADYRTVDGTARAGMDYVATIGTVTFAVGQADATVRVPLIDNGMVDGERRFELKAFNLTGGLTNWIFSLGDEWSCSDDYVGVIHDNEHPPTRVDPFFISDVSPDGYGFVAEMPDGRILISGGRDGIAILQSDGRVDAQFVPRDALALENQLVPVHVFNDGRILARDVGTRMLVRLWPNGKLEQVINLPLTGYLVSYFVSAQPDGKLLFASYPTNQTGTVLHRVNSDGSADKTFTSAAPGSGSLLVQPDGKIVVGTVGGLFRLNADGSLDSGFSTVLGRSAGLPVEVYAALLRGNGRIIINGQFNLVNGEDRCCVAQLNPDGSLDPSFNPPATLDWSSPYFGLMAEQPDGRLIIPFGANAAVMRLNADGSVESTFAAAVYDFRRCGLGSILRLALTASGQILVAGGFDRVDGFPRPGLVRLLDPVPQIDFHVMTSAVFYRSSGLAQIRVVRTGSTTNPASVSFTTRDDTARAGEDYLTQSGTLNFTPFEVSKEVTVPLLARSGVDERRWFNLELSNPSAGYTHIVSTPIAILPDLRIATDSLQPRGGGSITITLHGTVPGRWYRLESSTDLKNWQSVAGNAATGSTLVFDRSLPKTSPKFFRARWE